MTRLVQPGRRKKWKSRAKAWAAALLFAVSTVIGVIEVPTVTQAATPVTAETVEWSSGEYQVTDNVTIPERVRVTGTVTLTIAAGKTLTVPKGISVYVLDGSTKYKGNLTIAGPGTLIAGQSGSIDEGYAGIGGENGQGKNGTLTITGGTVTAQGGANAPGIGSGFGANDGTAGGTAGGKVMISGGTVTATGGSGAAGIGSNIAWHTTGPYGYNPKTLHAPAVEIKGGTVTAEGGGGSVAIAGQYNTSKQTYAVTFADSIKVTNLTSGAAVEAAKRVEAVVSTKGAKMKTEEIKPVVTFNTNGGDAMAAKTFSYNEYVWSALGTPTRNGYTFDGWKKADGTMFTGECLKEDITLTAVWLKNHTVTFDIGSGATGQPAAQTVADGKTANPPENPTKSGSTCVGWLLNGNSYDFSTPVTKDLVLTANWTTNPTCELKFHTPYVTLTVNILAGQTVDAPPVSSLNLKEYQTFQYWKHGNEDGPFDFNTPIQTDSAWDFYVVFSELPEVEVRFMKDTGSSVEHTSKMSRVGYSITAPDSVPTKTGYTFDHWVDKNGNAYDLNAPIQESATEDGGNYLTITLYPAWKYSGYADVYTGTVSEEEEFAEIQGGEQLVSFGVALSDEERDALLLPVMNGLNAKNKLDQYAVDISKVIGDKDATKVNSVSVYLESILTNVHVAAGSSGAVVDKLVYSITPKAKINVAYDGSNGGEVTIKNSDLTAGAMIPVKLPIPPTGFQSDRVDVLHTGSDGFSETYSNLTVEGSGDTRYVMVTVSHFSEFTITPAGTQTDTGSGSGSGGSSLPNTDASDARNVFLLLFAGCAIVAAGAYGLKRRLGV